MATIGAEDLVNLLHAQFPDRSVHVPETVFFIYDTDVFRAACDRVGAEEQTQWLYAQRPARRLFLAPSFPRAGLMHLEIGAPVLAYLVEILMVLGMRQLFIVTTVGALRPHLRIGDCIIIDQACSKNGVTWHYFPDISTCSLKQWFYSSKVMSDLVRTVFDALGERLQSVRSLSSDVFFRTVNHLSTVTRYNIDVVEMEVATAFAIGALRGVEVGAYGQISDVLSTEWEVDLNLRDKTPVVEATIALIQGTSSGAHSS